MPSFENRNTDAKPPRSSPPFKSLATEQIVEIHALLDLGAAHDALAEKYGISVGLVRSIASSRERADEHRRQLEEGDPELEALHESRLQAFLEQTQGVSDVIRHRIREYRKARKMSQEHLAVAMTERGFRLDKSRISKIETGNESRGFEIEELFAFADALRVPFADLVTPAPGDKPIRAGEKSWESHEVADWLIRGPWWEREVATTRIRGGVGTNLVERLSILKTARQQGAPDD